MRIWLKSASEAIKLLEYFKLKKKKRKKIPGKEHWVLTKNKREKKRECRPVGAAWVLFTCVNSCKHTFGSQALGHSCTATALVPCLGDCIHSCRNSLIRIRDTSSLVRTALWEGSAVLWLPSHRSLHAGTSSLRALGWRICAGDWIQPQALPIWWEQVGQGYDHKWSCCLCWDSSELDASSCVEWTLESKLLQANSQQGEERGHLT